MVSETGRNGVTGGTGRLKVVIQSSEYFSLQLLVHVTTQGFRLKTESYKGSYSARIKPFNTF
jgi:hypothetical protein